MQQIRGTNRSGFVSACIWNVVTSENGWQGEQEQALSEKEGDLMKSTLSGNEKWVNQII